MIFLSPSPLLYLLPVLLKGRRCFRKTGRRYRFGVIKYQLNLGDVTQCHTKSSSRVTVNVVNVRGTPVKSIGGTSSPKRPRRRGTLSPQLTNCFSNFIARPSCKARHVPEYLNDRLFQSISDIPRTGHGFKNWCHVAGKIASFGSVWREKE